MNPLLTTWLSDVVLEGSFDPGSLSRGHDYFLRQRVRQIDLTGRHRYLASAVVLGSRAAPYFVGLSADEDPDGSYPATDCTCPVATQCKHGVALAYAIRAALDESQPNPWRSGLQRVLDELDATRRKPHSRARQPSAGPLPLALQFQVADQMGGRYPTTPYPTRVTVRPLRRGAKGQWVKTGAQWNHLTPLAEEGVHEPAQLDALMALHGALSVPMWSNIAEIDLQLFGPHVWRLLRNAADAGVALVGLPPVRAVTVVDQPVAVEIDVTTRRRRRRDRPGRRPRRSAASRCRADDHRAPRPRRRPAPRRHDHARSAGAQGARGTDRARHRARARALRDLDELTTDLLPELARHVAIRSSDDTIAPPEPVVARLRLSVTWHGASRAALRWEWVYGQAVHTAPGHPIARAETRRDHGQERQLIDQLSASDALSPLGMADHAIGQAAMLLATAVLPRLAATGLVEIVEHDRPEFRAAQGAPEISFDVTETTTEGGTDWLDLMVMVTVDGEAIALPDVIAALTLGHEHIVLPSGLYVATDRPELRDLADLVTAARGLRDPDARPDDDRISVGSHDLGLWAQVAELGEVDAQAKEWVGRAQALRDLTDLPEVDPVGVISTLRDYQRDGVRWLAYLWGHGLGGILADDMGLGKTLQVLALISHARAARSGPFLVVAPSSVVSAWVSEAERHTPTCGLPPSRRPAPGVTRPWRSWRPMPTSWSPPTVWPGSTPRSSPRSPGQV